ncbi:MAG: hypothetical protein OXU31_08325 [Gammaproteobacteria bacterium]|nr:hypothetical protein [Gammaproteobacteria bacterium]MDD9815960.1 hypothetical protein [Gammaproteobacteria bacterium]MDD9871419.1 hypothetical protein [Gammaproteobacteria bacterium]
MNEVSLYGAQKRIDFLGRWALAFFAVFIVLAGWIGNRISAGEFGIMFLVGIGCCAISLMACVGCGWTTHRRIQKLEAQK